MENSSAIKTLDKKADISAEIPSGTNCFASNVVIEK